MSRPRSSVKVATGMLELVFLTAIVWVLRGYVWPTFNSVEVHVLQARLDPELFRHDFVVQESLRFTPRFYYNELILLLTRLGASLATAFALLHLLSLALLISGGRALGRALGLGAWASAVLLVWLLTVNAGTLGDTFFYTHAPAPAVWAAAFLPWSAAFAVRQQWTKAYACLGAAALLQFLVGFYAGLLALPLLLTRATRKSAAAAISAWAVGLALVYIPLRLTDSSGTGALDAKAFVTIYAHLRHPHHLVPSSWGWSAWFGAISFWAAACFFLKRTRSGANPVEQYIIVSTVAVTVGLLAANYLLIEVWPSTWFAKLQPARVTPLAQAILLGLLANRLQTRSGGNDIFGAVVLSMAPFSRWPGLPLLALALLHPPINLRFTWRHGVIAAALLLAFDPFDPSISNRLVRYALWTALVIGLLISTWLAARRTLLAAATLLAISLAAGAAFVSRHPRWPSYLGVRFAVNAGPIDALGRLGQRLENQSSKDAHVLLPPGSNSWSFKLHARRSTVVDEKNFPFTDLGMIEWHRRLELVLGTSLPSQIGFDQLWARRSSDELTEVSREFHASYIVTHDEWHPELRGQRIDREDGWSVWQLP